MSEAIQTRHQQQARKAYERVTQKEGEKWAKDYGRLCLRLPALIQQCGLCQTIAFYESKAVAKEGKPKPEYHSVLSDLAAMVNAEYSREDLAGSARTASVVEYQRLTREALSGAEWLARYARAVLQVEPTEEVSG